MLLAFQPASVFPQIAGQAAIRRHSGGSPIPTGSSHLPAIAEPGKETQLSTAIE